MAKEEEKKPKRKRKGKLDESLSQDQVSDETPKQPSQQEAIDQFPIPAPLVEHVLLGPVDDRQVLQDSPVLGDVWLAYAADPASIQDLLITPHKDTTAAAVADAISTGLGRIGRAENRVKGARIAYLKGFVPARLYFDEVLRVLVPLTQWWQERGIPKQLEEGNPEEIRRRMHRILAPESFRENQMRVSSTKTVPVHEYFSSLDRYIALAGLIFWVGKQEHRNSDLSTIDIEDVFQRYAPNIDKIVDGMLELYGKIQNDKMELQELAENKDDIGGQQDEEEEGRALIFQIS